MLSTSSTIASLNVCNDQGLKNQVFLVDIYFVSFSFCVVTLATNKPFIFRMYYSGVWYVSKKKKVGGSKILKNLDLPVIKLAKLMRIA